LLAAAFHSCIEITLRNVPMPPLPLLLLLLLLLFRAPPRLTTHRPSSP
jgi:hypothetical protein